MPRFGRVLSAMVTPFDDEGSLDLDVARELARYLQDHGHDGLVVAGTTGEAPVLSEDEKLSLFAAVCEAVTIPVVAALGAALSRLQPYAPRLETVCQRVTGGETNMFTGVMCGSDHDVWMELHEDLILTQGIDRMAEGSF